MAEIERHQAKGHEHQSGEKVLAEKSAHGVGLRTIHFDTGVTAVTYVDLTEGCDLGVVARMESLDRFWAA